MVSLTTKMKHDPTGQRYDRLYVVRRVLNDRASGNAAFLCKCDCGNETIVKGSHLRQGHTRSCGCRFVDFGGHHTHGGTGTSEYNIWRSMLQRCSDPKREDYHGRGISVCDRWMDFETFRSDMGVRPSKKLSIERLDNDGNYEPGNCIWGTRKQQSRNRRNNILVEYAGRTMCLAEAAELAGVNYKLAWFRHNAGWPLSRVLS